MQIVQNLQIVKISALSEDSICTYLSVSLESFKAAESGVEIETPQELAW